LNAIGDAELIAFSKHRDTAHYVQDLAFSLYRPDEYPQLKHLVIDMDMAPDDGHDPRVVNQLVTLLRAWTVIDGHNDRLFDGVGNIDLQARIVHIECGKLGDANAQMREAALYLITQQVRRRIISLPRHIPKAALFEEASQILKVTKGAALLKEFMAKMRGYSLCAGVTIQAYEQLRADPAMCEVIFSCLKMCFILKMNNPNDLDHLCSSISGLPEFAKERIQSFISPEHLNYEYSSVLYHHLADINNITGTFRVMDIK
jgi:hypothetical protein